MFFVYVLKSLKDQKLYIGSTRTLEARLNGHNSGKVRSTKGQRPFVLVYKEKFETNNEARKREIFLKTGRGRKLLNEILKNQLNS